MEKKRLEAGSVLGARKTRTKEEQIEAGVLDTVQNLRNEKIRRRDQVVNTAWYKFLLIMLYIGGFATLAWINYAGYVQGRGGRTVAADPTKLQSSEMTTSTVKAALAEAETILASADRIAKVMKPEPPPAPPSVATPPEVKVDPPKPVEKPKPTIWDLNQ